jgi:hypothetical protein
MGNRKPPVKPPVKPKPLTPFEQELIDSLSSAGSTTTSTSSGSTRTVSITPKETAYSKLDQDIIAMFGRRATVKEKSAFFKALNAAEKRNATTSYSSGSDSGSKSTGSTSTTNYLFDEDSFRFEFVSNLAANYRTAGKPLGGKAGQIFESLKSYAASMGVSDTDKTIVANTLNVIRGKADETSTKANIRKRAVSLYGGLAERLNADPTLTVRDAASDYIQIMSNMLDLNGNGISLHDTTLSKALNATKDGKPYTMNLNEFSNTLRQDARFQYSTTAHNEARDLASTFASAFGFGG